MSNTAKVTRIVRKPRFVAIYQGGSLEAIQSSTSLRGGLEEFFHARRDFLVDPIYTGNMLSCLDARGGMHTYIAREFEEES